MTSQNEQSVFKIATRAAWEAACRAGTFQGSEDDLRDGFIHLSTADQIRGTLAKHFKGQRDLLLIRFCAGDLGAKLKWERARGGDLFPHLYAPLPTAAARAVHALTRDDGGTMVVSGDIWQC